MADVSIDVYKDLESFMGYVDEVAKGKPFVRESLRIHLAGSQRRRAMIINYEDLADHIEFQYNPTRIGDDRNVEYAALNVHGRSHPIYQFAYGGERTLSMTVEVHGSTVWVNKFIDFCRSFTYPTKRFGKFRRAPDRLIFIMGDIRMNALMTQCNVKRHGQFALNLASKQATLDIQFVEWVKSTRFSGESESVR